MDGAHESSSSVEATVGVERRYRPSSPAPNPFRRQAHLHLSPERTQPVRVELFDLLGRRMQGLRDGDSADQVRPVFTIDGRQVPSGAYWVRVRGPHIDAVRRVMLVREPTDART